MDAGNEELGRLLEERRQELGERIVDHRCAQNPDWASRYGKAGRGKCLQDTLYHLLYLGEAVGAGQKELFADYAVWAGTLLEGLGIPREDLVRNLETMRAVLAEELPGEAGVLADQYIGAGMERLAEAQVPASFIDEERPLGALASQYLEALLAADRQRASRLVLAAVEDGTAVADIYLHVFQQSQYEIGRLWQLNRVSVAQEHFCTAATQLIMSQLYPYIFTGARSGRRLVAACVSGDLHEIGVRMVADFFEMDGWDTFYLGANVPTESVVSTAAEQEADVLAISATITGHVRRVAELVAAMRGAGLSRPPKVLVGGYPFNVAPELWRRVGADGCATDAQGAIALAEKLIAER